MAGGPLLVLDADGDIAVPRIAKRSATPPVPAAVKKLRTDTKVVDSDTKLYEPVVWSDEAPIKAVGLTTQTIFLHSVKELPLAFTFTSADAGGTDLEGVGYQLWPISLLLSEFVLTHSAASGPADDSKRHPLVPTGVFDQPNTTAIELGGGIGVVAAIVRRMVTGLGMYYCTDLNLSSTPNTGVATAASAASAPPDLLSLAVRNISQNVPPAANGRSWAVRSFDWTKSVNPIVNALSAPIESSAATVDTKTSGTVSSALNAFEWNADRDLIQHRLKPTESESSLVLLASDVIYDDELTDAFITQLLAIFAVCPAARLFLAVERRIVFTIAAGRPIAHAFEYFRNELSRRAPQLSMQCLYSGESLPDTNSSATAGGGAAVVTPCLPLSDLPQRFKCYQRTAQMDIFQIITTPPTASAK